MKISDEIEAFKDFCGHLRVRSWRLIKRDIRYFIQRRTRGWDNSETWNLDVTLAKMIAPRLAEFRRVVHGRPMDLTEKQWDEALAKMQSAFEYYADDEKYLRPYAYEVHQEGLDLFAKYYGHLWD